MKNQQLGIGAAINRSLLFKGRTLGSIACAAAVVGLASCGGGGGGSTPPPNPPYVAGVADTRTIQSETGETVLVFRSALLANAVYPVNLGFQITSKTAAVGTNCQDGADYYVAAAPNLSSAVAANVVSGSFSVTSATALSQITIMACPGTDTTDATLNFSWQDGIYAGTATGTIRGARQASANGAKVLNDTGIASCASATQANLACPVASFAGQDGEQGRDANTAITGEGAAKKTAFAFTPLASGACIQDNVTGLVWEGKANTSSTDRHNAGSTFTWYSSDTAVNGGNAGTANGGACTTGACDTEQYVQAVNAASVCGFTDWRLPTVDELTSIVDSGLASGATAPAAMTNQQSGLYWTGVTQASALSNGSNAWVVDFNSGAVKFEIKSKPAHVRLVRGR